MHALVRGAIGAAALSALAALAPTELAREATSSTADLPLVAGCRPRTVPDGAGCAPVPALDVAALSARAPVEARELILRQPERPEALAQYVPFLGAVPARLDDGALVYSGARGQPVHLVALEHQVGPAELRFAGDLDGPTIVSLHTVQEGSRARRYLTAYTGLDAIASNLLAGSLLAEGARLGTAGSSFRVELRQLRDAADLERIAPKKLLASSVSLVTDPRNVLQLAPAP